MVTGLVYLVIYIAIVAAICGLLLWLLSEAPFIPDPFRGIVRFAIIAIFVLIVVLLLVNALPGSVHLTMAPAPTPLA